MMKWKQVFGFAVWVIAAPTMASIIDITGDIKIGPARDIVKNTLVCKDAMTFFAAFEMIANGKRKQAGDYLDEAAANGACTPVPTTSVVVTALKMAKVSGTDQPQASLYVIANVYGDGFAGYVVPNTLSNLGFDIIKTAQAQNKKNGTPLVQ